MVAVKTKLVTQLAALKWQGMEQDENGHVPDLLWAGVHYGGEFIWASVSRFISPSQRKPTLGGKKTNKYFFFLLGDWVAVAYGRQKHQTDCSKRWSERKGRDAVWWGAGSEEEEEAGAPLPPPTVPGRYRCSCGWGGTRFRLNLTWQNHCFCSEGCGEVELERVVSFSHISSVYHCSCTHTAISTSKVLILNNLIFEPKLFLMDCNNFGRVPLFYLDMLGLFDHNGSSS